MTARGAINGVLLRARAGTHYTLRSGFRAMTTAGPAESTNVYAAHWTVQPTLSERADRYAARYASAKAQPTITREDYALPNQDEVDRGAFAFVLRNVYTPEECVAMIAASEERGYEQALVNTGRKQVLDVEYRNSARNMWDNHEAAGELFARVRSHLPSGEPRSFGYFIEPRSLVCDGLNERLRFLRYDPGDFFAKHRDGSYPRSDGSSQSYLTLLLFLNSGGGVDYEGGETCFVEDIRLSRERPGSASRSPDVVHTPQAGDVLIFAHPVLHQGNEVSRGRKYVVRTDVMYSDPAFPQKGVWT